MYTGVLKDHSLLLFQLFVAGTQSEVMLYKCATPLKFGSALLPGLLKNINQHSEMIGSKIILLWDVEAAVAELRKTEAHLEVVKVTVVVPVAVATG